MKSKNILIVTVLAVLPMSVYAATNTDSTPQEKFTSLDINQDGYISRDEAMMDENLSTHWVTIDINEDGKLEESEFSAFEEEMAPEGETAPKTGAEGEPAKTVE